MKPSPLHMRKSLYEIYQSNCYFCPIPKYFMSLNKYIQIFYKYIILQICIQLTGNFILPKMQKKLKMYEVKNKF